jgi:hypothetical protein
MAAVGVTMMFVALVVLAGEIAAWAEPLFPVSLWLAGVAAMGTVAVVMLFRPIAGRRWLTFLGAVALGILALHLVSGPLYFRFSETRARLVMLETGMPARNAVVTAEWRLRRQSSLEASRDAGLLHRTTVRSDATGMFRLAGWGPQPRPFLRWLDEQAPTLTVTTSDGQQFRVDDSEALVSDRGRVGIMRSNALVFSSHLRAAWRDLDLLLTNKGYPEGNLPGLRR